MPTTWIFVSRFAMLRDAAIARFADRPALTL